MLLKTSIISFASSHSSSTEFQESDRERDCTASMVDRVLVVYPSEVVDIEWQLNSRRLAAAIMTFPLFVGFSIHRTLKMKLLRLAWHLCQGEPSASDATFHSDFH